MNRGRWMRSSVSWAVGASLLSPSLLAAQTQAEPPPEQEAHALFVQGLEQIKKGDMNEGCFLFAQSIALVPRVTTKFNLADCLEKTGKKAAALTLFREVALAMQAAGDSARQSAAEERAQALKAVVCRLRIQTEKQIEELTVRHDGEALEPSSWAAGVPVDSGTYSLEASAPGKLSWSVEVQVPVCPSAVSVKIPALQNDPQWKPPVAKTEQHQLPERTGTVAALPSVTPTDSVGNQHSPPLFAYALTGFGVISTAVGSVFLASYQSDNHAATDICPTSKNCTVVEIQRHTDLVESARSALTKGYIGVSLGAVALVTGSFLILSDFYAPKRVSQGAKLKAAPLLGNNGWPVAGAVIEGSF